MFSLHVSKKFNLFNSNTTDIGCSIVHLFILLFILVLLIAMPRLKCIP